MQDIQIYIHGLVRHSSLVDIFQHFNGSFPKTHNTNGVLRKFKKGSNFPHHNTISTAITRQSKLNYSQKPQYEDGAINSLYTYST